MYTRGDKLTVNVKPHAQNGEGQAVMKHLISAEQFCGHGSLFAHITLEKGSSVGWHVHTGESETYYVIKGQALFNDNNKEEVVLNVGDVSYTASGEGHSIKAISDEPLEFIAMIVKA